LVIVLLLLDIFAGDEDNNFPELLTCASTDVLRSQPDVQKSSIAQLRLRAKEHTQAITVGI